MSIMQRICFPVLLLSLSACSGGTTSWSWQHPQGLDPAQRERDLSDCMYYASITDPRAFGADRPVIVQEWDEPVRECMALRGWLFVEAGKNAGLSFK